MYQHITLTVLALITASTAMAFTAKAKPAQVLSQPAEERAAQNSLPMANGLVWNTLLKSKISYSDKVPHISASLTPDIKAMNARTIIASGFMLPMDSGEKSTHFLLSKRTPTCPFCPPGEPNEVIEIYTTKGIKYDDSLLTLQGKFELTNNTENGIFFVMKNAQLVSQVKPGAVTSMAAPDKSSNLP